MLTWAAQQSGEVSGGVYDLDDDDTVRRGPVQDNVVSGRKHSQILGQIVAGLAHERLRGQQTELLEEDLAEPAGGGRVVPGNIPMAIRRNLWVN